MRNRSSVLGCIVCRRGVVLEAAARSVVAILIAQFALSYAVAAPRSTAAKAAFKREHPCPSTGHHHGACPGWVIDHVVPLCAGGSDSPLNMQWQTIYEAKSKDREEARMCRSMRKR